LLQVIDDSQIFFVFEIFAAANLILNFGAEKQLFAEERPGPGRQHGRKGRPLKGDTAACGQVF
jgi:hypothetical protein